MLKHFKNHISYFNSQLYSELWAEIYRLDKFKTCTCLGCVCK